MKMNRVVDKFVALLMLFWSIFVCKWKNTLVTLITFILEKFRFDKVFLEKKETRAYFNPIKNNVNIFLALLGA